MKLIKCPRCEHVVDIEYTEELDENDVIGCGQNKDNLAWCDGCACEHDEDECRYIRSEKGYTKTLVKDLDDDILRF